MGIFVQHTTAMRKNCLLYLETAYPENEDITEVWPNHQNPVPRGLQSAQTPELDKHPREPKLISTEDHTSTNKPLNNKTSKHKKNH